MPFKDPEQDREYQRAYYQKVRKQQRYNKKLQLLQMMGGKCSKCGYDKCTAALQFHHPDPSVKDFGIGDTFRSFDKLLKEAKKCVVLCANCHAEVHFESLSSSGQDPSLSSL